MYGSSSLDSSRSSIIHQKLVTRLNCKLHFCALLLPFLLHIGTYLIIDGPMKFVTTSIRSTIWNLYIRDARSTSKILNIGRVRVGIICILIDAFRIWQNWMSICNSAWIESEQKNNFTNNVSTYPTYLFCHLQLPFNFVYSMLV